MELPCHAMHLSTARQMARTLLDQSPADEEEMDNILLIIGELCGNVISHAQLSADKCFKVEVEIVEKTVFITVSDQGKGFIPDQTLLPAWECENGRGLWLIEALADEVDYKAAPDGGSSVLAKVSLGGKSGAANFFQPAMIG